MYSFRMSLPLLCVASLLAATAFDRGMDAWKAGDRARAARELEQAVREHPNDAKAQSMLGRFYLEGSGSWKAKVPLRRACALNPREPEACFWSGKAAYRLSLFAEALPAFQQASDLPADRARALKGMADTLAALARPKEAEEKYLAAIGAGDTGAPLDYAKFLLREGRSKDSLAVLEKAAVTLPRARNELERVRREVSTKTVKPAVSSASIRFRESTLDMVLRNGAAGEKHLPETVMGGVAIIDYDDDGWPDIFLTNGASLPSLKKTDASFQNRLFHNNRNGTFTDVTARAGVAGQGYSLGVAVGDFDNDGHPDLFVTGLKTNTLYRNRGDGTFEDVTAAAGLGGETGFSIAAGWFDYDNDGLLDLFVVRYVVWEAPMDVICGTVSPGLLQYCHPKAYRPMTNLLFHNEGKGRFRNVSKESGIALSAGRGMSVVFGDADGDGRLDAFVTNDKMPNFLFHNDGNGKFHETAVDAGVAFNDDGEVISAMGADFRDYDNDGREDLFVTALPDEMFTLYRNTGPNVFANVTSPSQLARRSRAWSGWSTGLFDLNNDGFKDIFVAGGHVLDNAEANSGQKSRLPNVVFPNNGDGTFGVETLPGDAFHRGAAFADFNRDGKVDVVVSRLNEKPLVLHNISGGTGHWIALRLAGTRSNRDGIGAMVHVITASGEQWNRVTTAVGYASSSDRIVHFGLGPATQIRSLEIAWPSGAKQKLANVPADRFMTVTEPAL